MELRTEDGAAAGTAAVRQQGEETVFTVSACLPEGLWRIVAAGSSGELPLGVVEGGVCTLHRHFSRALSARLGTVEWVTAQRCAGARRESEWQACRSVDAPHLPPLPPGALCRRESWGRTLAFPWQAEQPFPWTELFCLARVDGMAGRTWVFYSLNEAGKPILPEEI